MKDDKSHNRMTTRAAALLLTVLMAALLLACCSDSGLSGAEAKTSADIETLRSFEGDEAAMDELFAILDEDGRADYNEFISKVREFEYEITGSETKGDPDSAVVSVRIRTYDFASAYLETWTEYLRDHPNGEFDEKEFYTELFDELSDLEERDRIADVEINCTDTTGSGDWRTDTDTNAALRDAILGGLLTEMKTLAE